MIPNELMLAPAANVQPQREDKLNTIQRLGNLLAKSGYFSDVADLAQAAVKVMAGEELGIGPVASMMGINIIKGKVALSANLIAAQVRRHGYNYKVERLDTTGCELRFIGKAGEELGLSSFMESEAKNAGVYSDMYRKYPRNMYFARAMSNGTKWYCPEVMSGLPVYVPEELGATVDGDGEIVRDSPKDAAKAVGKRKIAEMQAQQEPQIDQEVVEEYELPPAPPAPTLVQKIEKPWINMKGFLEIMAGLKQVVGDDVYYEILTKHEVEHANQIKYGDKAMAVYTDLKAYADKAQQEVV